MSHTKPEMVSAELSFNTPYGAVHSRYAGTVKRFDHRACRAIAHRSRVLSGERWPPGALDPGAG